MMRETKTAAVMFADISNSTHLYEVLGDAQARTFLGGCLSLLSEIVEDHNGTVIKTIGDEIMSSYSTADQAVEAAIAMQKSLEKKRFESGKWYPKINIRIGFNFGQVISESGDVYGDAVNVAARIAALAKQRQILTTEQTVTCLKPEFRSSARFIEKSTIKGKSGEIGIFEIVWEHKDVTMVLESLLQHQTGHRTYLELKFRDHVVKVDETNPVITFGRQNYNDIVVDDRRVSRSHARIEYRRGKFILVDQSTNGTCLLAEGEAPKTLIRDEAPISGKGRIGLGYEPDTESSEVIRYEIKWSSC
ncbi:MAG: adenylate/guanylate cyclase domain-containing protein [Thermodesulfobacteriota bacterium]